MKSISMQAFYKKYQSNPKLKILDVREEDEYVEGHIEEAMLYPLSRVEHWASELAVDQPYFLICRSSHRSKIVGEYLAKRGYDVTDVEGGMLEWEGDLAYGIQPKDR